MSRIGLGTAQFGLDYGISNENGKTSLSHVRDIMSYANDNGITCYDTAPSYGDSEQVIGKVAQNISCNIVTKTKHLSETVKSEVYGSIIDTFQDSLINLKRDFVYGLLVHDAADLIEEKSDHVYQALSELKQKGLVKKIGVSVYEQEQAEKILDRFDIDLIQLPVNIFDQRLVRSGFLKKLKDQGIEVHSRSCFLQGLVFMNPNQLNSYFDPIKNILENFNSYVSKSAFSALDLALGYVLSLPEIDSVICGVNDIKQLQEIIISSTKRIDMSEASCFAIDDKSFVNPAHWRV